MTQDQISILMIILIPAGTAVLLGVIIQFAGFSKRRNCNHLIKGKVDSYEFKNGACIPVVRFTYQGSRYYARLRDRAASKQDYPIDSEVEVHFNSAKPSQNYIGEKSGSIAGWALIVAGVLVGCLLAVTLL